MFFPDVGRTSRERRSDHQEVALTVPQICGFRVHVFLLLRSVFRRGNQVGMA